MHRIKPNTHIKIAVLTFLFFICACATQGWADSKLTWHTDLDKAQQIAANNDKHVLLHFTGSDWCPWCIKLDTNVFSTPEFAEFAASELVLVKVDFPKRHQLSQEQAAANEKLSQKYRVRGFPTLIMLNSKGERVGTTGFRRGSATSYIEHLRGMKE
jgi:protein disulfide-isomerase